jgi:hypothetical protein
MTASNILIENEDIPLASLPDVQIERRKGLSTYIVTVTVDTTFSSTILDNCTIGNEITIKVDGVSYLGTISGFGCRTGHSIVQIEEATCAH